MLRQCSKIKVHPFICVLLLASCQQPKDERTVPPPGKSLDLISRSFCGDTNQSPPIIDRRFRVEEVLEQLNEGLRGRIEGIFGNTLAVSTINNEEEGFFIATIVNPEISILSLNQGDIVSLIGEAENNTVRVQRLDMIRKSSFTSRIPSPRFKKDSVHFFRVHALTIDPSTIILEASNRTLPLFGASDTSPLFRGDFIRATIATSTPEGITASRFERWESIYDCHDQRKTLTGDLTFIPSRSGGDRYGIRIQATESISRVWIPVQPENEYQQALVQTKLAKAWNQTRNGRRAANGMFINREIQVTVDGTLSITSPYQAFPEIIVDENRISISNERK